MRMHKTNNDLKSNAKRSSIELLMPGWPTASTSRCITKQAHWNLKGPQFIGIHLMLDGFRTEQDEWVDTMAERVIAARRHRARHDAGGGARHQPAALPDRHLRRSPTIWRR